jgi:hypothetical protein
MKRRRVIFSVLLASGAWTYFYIPEPTVISVRIGQTFTEVARASSFPVMTSSNIPDNALGSGATWVTKPSVIIRYNDPKHGFTLPATTFAAISYMDGKVDTIATSPMLGKMTFGKAIEEVAALQSQFQAGGWQLDNGTSWYDLTPQGRERLHGELRKLSNGYMETKMLVIPQKYSMIFRIWCAERCDSNIGLDRYLIDIGLGEDFGYEIEKRELRKKRQHGQ